MTRFDAWRMVLVLVGAVLLIGGVCRRTEPDPTEPRAVLHEDTRLPEEEPGLKEALSDTATNTLRLVFEPGTELPTYEPGNILLGAQGDGYLVRVVSLDELGDTLLVNTKPASLVEAFEELRFEETFRPTAETQSFGAGGQVMRGTSADGDDVTVEITWGELSINNLDGWAFEVRYSGLRVDIHGGQNGRELMGWLELDDIVYYKRLEVDCGIDINWFRVDSFALVATSLDSFKFDGVKGEMTSSLTVEYEEEGFRTRLGSTTVYIYGVPVVFTFDFRLLFGIDFNFLLRVAGQLDTGLRAGMTIKAGVVYYRNDGWSPVWEFDLGGQADFSFNSQMNVEANLKTSYTGCLDVLLYGQVGPGVWLSGYLYAALDYDTEETPPLDYEVGAGIDLGLLFRAQILTRELGEWRWSPVGYRWPFLRSQRSEGRPTVPTGPSTGDFGTPHEFAASATVPSGGEAAIRFDWGNGDTSGWSSYRPVGEPVSMTYTWSEVGEYRVRAQSKDRNDNLSPWSFGSGISIAVPRLDTLRWRYRIDGNEVQSSPAIAADGTVYVGAFAPDDHLYAINPDGTLKWRYSTGLQLGFASSPAVGADGTVYVGSPGYLYAINPSGTLKWRYPTMFSFTSPAVGADGTVYVGSHDRYLYAINPDGTLKWRYQTGGMVFSSPALAADGTVYFGSNDSCLYALNPDGTLKWRYQTGGWVKSSPAIAADGTVYVGSFFPDNHLYAINPNGTLKWRYQTDGQVESSPAIGSDGTVYVGSHDRYLYAINPDGTLKWRYQTGGMVYSSPALAADGTVYVGSRDSHLYAINTDGRLKWQYRTGQSIFSSPAIAADGTVYVGSDDGYLYAINGDSPLARTSWPKFRRNARNTGRIGTW